MNVAVNELSTRKNGKEKKKKDLFLFDQQTAEGQLRFIDESHALPTFLGWRRKKKAEEEEEAYT